MSAGCSRVPIVPNGTLVVIAVDPKASVAYLQEAFIKSSSADAVTSDAALLPEVKCLAIVRDMAERYSWSRDTKKHIFHLVGRGETPAFGRVPIVGRAPTKAEIADRVPMLSANRLPTGLEKAYVATTGLFSATVVSHSELESEAERIVLAQGWERQLDWHIARDANTVHHLCSALRKHHQEVSDEELPPFWDSGAPYHDPADRHAQLDYNPQYIDRHTMRSCSNSHVKGMVYNHDRCGFGIAWDYTKLSVRLFSLATVPPGDLRTPDEFLESVNRLREVILKHIPYNARATNDWEESTHSYIVARTFVRSEDMSAASYIPSGITLPAHHQASISPSTGRQDHKPNARMKRKSWHVKRDANSRVRFKLVKSGPCVHFGRKVQVQVIGISAYADGLEGVAEETEGD